MERMLKFECILKKFDSKYADIYDNVHSLFIKNKKWSNK